VRKIIAPGPTRGRASLLVAAVLVAGWSTAWVVTRETSSADAVVAVGLPVAVGCGAGAALLSLRWRTGADRVAWALMCTGLLTWACVASTAGWRSLGAELLVSGTPSALVTGLIAVTVVTGTSAFALFLRPVNTTAGLLRDGLECALLAAAGGTAVWHLVEAAASTSGVRATAVSTAVVVADLLVLATALHTGVRTRRRAPRLSALCALTLLVVGCDLAGTVLLLLGGPGWGDAMAWAWLLAAAGLVVTASRPPARGPAPEEGHPALGGAVLPCTAALLALASAAPATLDGQHTGATSAWLHVTLMALLVARCSLLVLDGDRLTRGLGERVEERTREVASAERRFASLLAHGSDLVLVVDGGGAITYASPSAERTTGVPADLLLGRPLRSALDATDPAALAEALRSVSTGGGARRTLRLAARHATGRALTLDVTVTGLLDDAAVRGTVVNVHDVTEAERLADELSQQAFSDALTGLPNRALFKDRLEHALRSRGTARPSRSATSTSTASRPSTTPSATAPVTSCWCWSPSASWPWCARATPWPASVVTSSPSCSTRPPGSRTRSASCSASATPCGVPSRSAAWRWTSPPARGWPAPRRPARTPSS